MRLKTLAYLILIIIVLSQPTATFQYAYQGLYQWAVKMVPTLFPFMMISSVMIYSGADIELGHLLSHLLKRVYHYSEYGLYAIFIGFLCGFPMGAKVVSELYENDKISQAEAQSLLGFCNNIGPAYFLGIILPILGECGYHNKLPFLFGMYGIPAVYGILLSRRYTKHSSFTEITPNSKKIQNTYSNNKNNKNTNSNNPHYNKPIPLPSIIKKACLENTQSLILLGGYITFTNSFRILLDFIPIAANGKSVLSSFIEIIGGVQSIYITTLSSAEKVFWTMTALCFSGISCLLQTSSFLEKSNLSLFQYLKNKVFITGVSAIYYIVILVLMNPFH